ncbi:MAG TPA: DEAD/DEAH box helicase family protein [Opitutus sp.]|nr:DEAD/DEAH box helicase family protein [Opitutus sp.]
MSLELKHYQGRVLRSLRMFFRESARDGHPEAAFQAALIAQGREPMPYLPVSAAGLGPGLPYVCLRVPTGGGKTLLAAHAVGLALSDYQRADHGVVLWLVPSRTILDQTADALRDPRHPYRQALAHGGGEFPGAGPVEVLTIDEALQLSRATVAGATVVIVSTIQAFKAEDTTGRKVFGQNDALAEHLLNLPANRVADLLPGADGRPVPSLVNVLRLRRPVVIVDEAHNARTELSFATLGAVLPSCIVEFTATPDRKRNPSNVLHHVSAAELKAENMVKLPLRVIVRHPSQRDQLLAEAITLRADLERIAAAEAQGTQEYLRPILLIQAERVDACEPLRDRLVRDFQIDRAAVLISVGKLDELKDADLASPKSRVRVILTVEKLREGWDCPFAYVLCSLKETRSATAIEQIVGRILRLPGATAKRHPDLNCAYAFSVSASIQEVLAELREALENNGFTKAEAERILVPVSQGVMPLGVQPQTVPLAADTEVDTAALQTQVERLAGKVRFDAAKGELTVIVPLDVAETERLSACAQTPEAKRRIAEAVETVREAERAFGGTGATRAPTPYERQIDFIVPLLAVREGEALMEFESTFLLEHAWKLSEKDASLPDIYDPTQRPTGRMGVLDADAAGHVTTQVVEESASADFVATLHQQVFQLGGAGDWTLDALAAWLDRQIEHRDIPMGEMVEFLRKALRGLMAKFGLGDVSALALDRFRLRDQLEARIDSHRRTERKAAFQSFLLPESALAVDEGVAINFRTMSYEPSWRYEGGYRFQKHYFTPKPGELAEKTPAGEIREEFKCAQWLDDNPAIAFWTRNLSNKATSFRLQTSTDWFYPDFICQLKNGCSLAVESKGGHLAEGSDAEEKRLLGHVWESRSGGRCVFVMPVAGEFGEIQKAINRAQGRQAPRWAGKIAEHDRVRLTQDLTEGGETIPRGAEGAVVSVYRDGEGYAVEFVAGRAYPAVVTVRPGQLEPIEP